MFPFPSTGLRLVHDEKVHDASDSSAFVLAKILISGMTVAQDWK
jgi:hypothetical protein